MLISLFVGRWAELDPQAAIAYAQTLPAGTARNWAMTSAVGGWAEHDATAATAWVQQLPAGPARDQAMQTIVSALADKDPQAALAFLQNLPAGRNRQNLYWPIFSRWTMTDPVAAAERAMQMPGGANRDTALQVVGSNWANQDPEAAFAWANTLPAGQGRNNALQNILASWANKDPQKAAAIITALPPGPVRDQSISNVARQWAQTDARAALKWTPGITAGRWRNAMPCAPSWSAGCNRNRRGCGIRRLACRREKRRKKRPWRCPAISQQRCAKRDQLGRRNSRQARRGKMRSPILSRNGASPIRRPRLILPCGRMSRWRKTLLENISRQWARNDPQAALTWAGNLPDATTRDLVLPGIIASSRNPIRAKPRNWSRGCRPRKRKPMRLPRSPGNGRGAIRRRRVNGSLSFRKAKFVSKLLRA